MNKNLKPILLEKCQQQLDHRLNAIQKTIAELQEALQAETKSTAGDKHETGRAMIQLEREKAGQQLAEIQKAYQILNKIDSLSSTKTIGLGAIVMTTHSNYFISVSTGEFAVDQLMFYAISPKTPIAQLLLGKTIGDTIQFRSQSFEILKVL